VHSGGEGHADRRGNEPDPAPHHRPESPRSRTMNGAGAKKGAGVGTSIGDSPLSIDLGNLADRLGTLSAADRDRITGAWKALQSRFESGEVGFFRAPVDDALSQ